MTKEEALNELLAVIHGDGGHYQSRHGALKAIQDAIKIVEAPKTKTATKLITNNPTWFGMNCEHQINQFCDSDTTGQPQITFCNHEDNSSVCEGNCYKENCPLQMGCKE